MCGRYVKLSSTSALTDEFAVEGAIGNDVGSSSNISPADPLVRVIVQRWSHSREAERQNKC